MIYRAEEKGVWGKIRLKRYLFRVMADNTIGLLETSNGKNQQVLIYTLS